MNKTVHLHGKRAVASISFNKKTLDGCVIIHDKYKLNDIDIQTRKFKTVEELMEVTEDIINKLIENDEAKFITSSEYHTIIHSDLVQDFSHHKL